MALGIPDNPGNPNIRSLANLKTEEVTGIAGVDLTFQNVIDPTYYLLFKNGALLRPSTLTVVGNVITLGSAATGTDWFVLLYHYRSS